MERISAVLLLFILVLVLVTFARKSRLPYPIVLVLGGLFIGFVPGLPHLALDPEIVFLLFLPPILYYAAVFTSFKDFRANLRPIFLHAVGLVLTTMAAVAGAAHTIVPGLTWPAAFVLGAIVSPPDAVSATAILRRLGVPQRVATILEGESLVNDATALVAYRMALAALITGTFSLPRATLQFVVVAAGGIAIGLAIGWLSGRVRRRVDDPSTQITLSLLTPFAAYLPAEELGVSGVLAVVTTGLYIGGVRLLLSPATRLQARTVWDVIVFLLNGLIFLLIGLQLPAVMRGLADVPMTRLLSYAAIVSLTAIVVRIVWVFTATYVPRFLSARLRERDPYPGWRNVAVIAWAGMRGIVSLAAAFALPFRLPDGTPFPGRDMILFLTFSLIIATLVGQGLTLPPLLRWLGLTDPARAEREERKARLEAARAAIHRLEELAKEDHLNAEYLDRLRWRYEQRTKRLGVEDPKETEHEICRRFTGDYERLRRELIQAERRVLRRLRDEGLIGDEVMLSIEHDLDVEESHVET
jgi:CPA1 family monovalent cation:H+ antiporter